jgi:hypothetical protein
MSAKSPDSDIDIPITNGGFAPPAEPVDEDPHAASNNAAAKNAGTAQPDRPAVLAMASPWFHVIGYIAPVVGTLLP